MGIWGADRSRWLAFGALGVVLAGAVVQLAGGAALTEFSVQRALTLAAAAALLYASGLMDRARRPVIVALIALFALAAFFLFREHPMPWFQALRGLSLGLLTALLALGLALVYRANRVLNFAQADLGTVPAALSVALVVFSGWSLVAGFVVGLAASVVVGAIVELVFVRRFKNASRLVLTVATLGISQVLVVLCILLPRWWGRNAASERLPQLVEDWHIDYGNVRLLSNDVVNLVVAPVVMLLVALFLNKTRTGVAVRAAAERGDRASMLGIPVGRLSTVVWSLSAALSFIATFLRAGIIGFPIGYGASLVTIVYAMAALVIGRMNKLWLIAVAGIAIGFVDYWVTFVSPSPLLVVPMVSAAVLVALLVQRRSSTRRDNDATSTWRAAEEVRPLDDVSRRLPLVRLARWSAAAAVSIVLVGAPIVLRVDRLILATEVLVFCIVGVSLMVLTGWAGQISLGQMGFVAVGGAVCALCTYRWQVDLTLSLLIGAAAGAAAALVVGLPALRLQGLYLAVTTMAFGLTATSWLLNDLFFGWVPINKRLAVRPLFGRLDIDTPTRFYVYTVVVLVLVVLAVRGIRRSRTGRVIIALRENERAAQSFAVATVRAKLTAFMLSGAIAGIAGGLFVHLNHSFSLRQFDPGQSLGVFTSGIIGGLGSITGVVIGALYSRITLRLPSTEWRLLATSVGVLLVLLVMPSGLGSQVTKIRDLIARAALKRRPPEPAAAADAPHAASPHVASPASTNGVVAGAAAASATAAAGAASQQAQLVNGTGS